MKKISIFTIIFLIFTLGYSQANDMGKLMFERASYLYKSQQFDSALIFINKAVKAAPNTEEYIFKRALIKEKINDKKGAIKDYKACIDINPKSVYFNNIGVIYAIDGKYEDALEWYNKALEKDSTYAQSWVNLGVAYYYMHKFDKACEAMHNASKYGLKMADSFIAANCN